MPLNGCRMEISLSTRMAVSNHILKPGAQYPHGQRAFFAIKAEHDKPNSRHDDDDPSRRRPQRARSSNSTAILTGGAFTAIWA